ncbi:hypothetical protein SpAn4DRAFT_4283 [Sporomusa ovata]|uniref:Uncharacterized protein n=1 Tax=Sporomusa ovata TaxID=2378 RepID=A0A0U1L5G2_9FIRM|nr:hypothetical protein SpAn4DRAFT_4283 [Sporomusa ovata]
MHKGKALRRIREACNEQQRLRESAQFSEMRSDFWEDYRRFWL